MPDVADWLRELGLAKYAKAFQDNEIDFAALPYLNESMLTQIGLPIGPRAKLLAAISELTSPSQTALADERRRSATAAQSIAPQQAERRQITVLFCDLVNSTELATRLDPEELRLVLETYHTTCTAIVERYGGYLAHFSGDGAMAYFGWPTAHEDAAERAVRAALAIVNAVKAVTEPEQLAVRAGVSTGIVVVGKTGLGDPSTPSDAFGDTLHLAARLQTFASPNSVVIAETTSRLISARFDQESLGPQVFKGIAKPIHVFQIRGVRDDASRFQAAHAQAMTPLVGRRTELAWLRQRWKDAKDGEGQVVFVSGAAGMGKSRIVYELEQSIKAEGRVKLRFQCLPHCMQSALAPIIQQIERLSNLTPEDSNEVKLNKIKRLISLANTQVDKTAPLVAELMSIPSDSSHSSLALTAEQLKAHILAVLVELLVGVSAKRPVFCVVEDAQWIDPSTQELLDMTISQIEKARIFIIVTHRPEYNARSHGAGNVSGITISRLSQNEVAEMARMLLGEQTVPPAMLKRIIEDSDAVPLFVEELSRGMVGSRDTAKHQVGNSRMQPAIFSSVPDSLRDSLAARLDRAPQARTVAQMAAVIGRDFSYDTLLQLSSLDGSELDLALSHLKESGIVQLIDNRPPAHYAFKHALLRDAAYESVLKSTRRELHARVGALLRQSPGIVAGRPELLAYHYSMAGNAELAARYWLQGGRRARSRSANLEATEQFQKALQFLEMLPETPERTSLRLEIHLSLGLCSIAVRGYSSDDTRNSFERARSLSVEVGEPQKEIQAIFGLWGHYWLIARHDRAIELAERLLAKAEQLNDPVAAIVGHRALGSTLFTLGDFVRARQYLEQAIAAGREEIADTSSLSLSYAADPRIAAQLILGWVLWILGYPAQAHRQVLDGLVQAERGNDPYTLAFAHYMTCAVQLLRGDFRDALVHADRCWAVSTEHRIDLYRLYSRFGRGCALAKIGQKERGINEVAQATQEALRNNARHLQGFMLGWLATLQAEGGDPDTALSTIDDALKLVNDISGRAWESELRCIRGKTLLLVRPNSIEEAERTYNDAILIAQSQHARSFELSATISLAELLLRQHRREEAHQRLAPLVGCFAEGDSTTDLRRAKALLAP